MITVPEDPVVYGGRMSHLYRFFPPNAKGDQTLIEISVNPIVPAYADSPPEVNLDPMESAYKSVPGAVVTAKPITLQGAKGREIDITAGPHAGTRKRIYVAHKLMYYLDFRPSMPHAIEAADSFQFQFSVQ